MLIAPERFGILQKEGKKGNFKKNMTVLQNGVLYFFKNARSALYTSLSDSTHRTSSPTG